MIKRITLKKQAYDYLLKIILKEEIKVGEVYSEQYFADFLEISRTPVREAVLQLAQEGFLQIHPNKGFSVKPASDTELIEMYGLRGAIEGYCAAAAAGKNNTPKGRELIEKLERYNNTEREAGLRGALPEECMENDFMFHNVLVAFVENTLIETTMKNLNAKMKMAGIQSFYKREGRISDVLKEHKKIIDAIKKGDKALAYDAVNEHFSACLSLILSGNLK